MHDAKFWEMWDSQEGPLHVQVLGALDDAPDDASTSSSSALAAGYMLLHSFIPLRLAPDMQSAVDAHCASRKSVRIQEC